MKLHPLTIVCLLVFTLILPLAKANEGMWTYDNFPAETVKKQYGFKPNKEWLNHAQLSSVRLAEGCSGSFVSENGLILTNHHCAHSCIEQLSTAQKDYVASGFYAEKIENEIKCPEIEVNQLVKIENVTQRLTKATQGLKDKEFNETQKSEMSKIEKECLGKSDIIRCDVVSLYHGGLYHLYKYRRFQDVRLVFAPEFAIAFFGGDPDNFMFPRYDYDLSFLRIYENNKPAKINHYFRWSSGDLKDGDLTFVSGHPGGSDRLLTVAQLEFQKDFHLMKKLNYLSELRGMLTEFQNRSLEEKRISNAKLFFVENSLKAWKGRYESLVDKTFFTQKIKAESKFRKKINANPNWKKLYGGAWEAISKAQMEYRNIYALHQMVEVGLGLSSDLFYIARDLVRGTVELSKPNEKRLREFTDSNMPAVKQYLFSEAPIYDSLEIAKLTFSLTKLREELGPDHAFVKKVFGSHSPADIASDLVRKTKLKDLKLRHQLFDGGLAAVEASTDPMIQFARLIDPMAREVRKNYEDHIESILKKNSELIAKAQFAVFGTKTYPDATFTLRLSYGQVKGYKENGKMIKPITNVGGVFDRHTGSDPFALPDSWLKAKGRLDLKTGMNFCSTNDIIGGNSGSPVINKSAEVVGLIFDGNIQSLGGDYGFDPTVNRAVAVHSGVILHALDNIYHARRLIEELQPVAK